MKPYGLQKAKLNHVTPPYGTKLVSREHAKQEALADTRGVEAEQDPVNKPTPTPWRYVMSEEEEEPRWSIVDANGDTVRLNAETIQKMLCAVNSHEALVDAVEVCLDRLEGEVTFDLIPATHSTLARVRAALKLAGEKL